MPNDGASSSTRRRRFVHLAGGIGVIALVVFIPGHADAASSADAMADCAATGTTAAPAAAPTTPAELDLDGNMTGGESLTFNFFRAREPESDKFVLTTKDSLPPKGTELETIQSPMRESTDGSHLRTAAVATRAVVLNRSTVVVTVCIDPHKASEGSYNGTVGLSDERVTAKPVHVVANLQYGHNLLVLGGGFGAALAALAMTYLAASDAGERLLHWIKQPRTIVGICAALLATGGVYLGSYTSDPNWRFSGDAATYLGIAYAAALAATGTVLGVAAGKDKTIAKAAAKVADQPPAAAPVVAPGDQPEKAPEDVKV